MKRLSVGCGALLWLAVPAVAGATGGGTVAVGTAPVSLDGSVDGAYRLLDEDTYAAPDVGQTGQTASSDLIGESAANLVWFGNGDANYLGYDDGAGLFVRGSGSADVQNLWVTWDDSYVYLAVEGPNAYFEGVGTGDDMDLFLAIDTQASSLTPTTPTLARAAVPGNKAVDFAGWAPNLFVGVRGIGATTHGASLYQGTTEIATDDDLTDVSGNFEVTGQHGAAVTEIRIAWSLVGGAPSLQAGAPWSLAVYTTYSGDAYDTFDTAPGMGQSTVFEELGDGPCDSDHCAVADGGDGSVDPVSGSFDACDCAATDDRTLGAGLSPTGTESPGSDHTGTVLGDKDVDTIQAYFRVTNVGQLPDADGDGTWDGIDECPQDPDKTEPGICGCGLPETCGGGGAGGDGGTGAGGAVPGGGSEPSTTGPGAGPGGLSPSLDEAIEDDGSCGCRTGVGDRRTTRRPWFLLLAGVALLRRRRRATTAPR